MKTIEQDSKSSVISTVPFITPSEAEEMQLTENDLQIISEMYERFLKANDKHQ